MSPRLSVRLSLLLLLAFGFTLAASPAGAGEMPKKGGIIRVGNLGEPPALDPHWTTASITETLTNHIYEGLYSLDDDNRPIPMLAESMPTVSRDGLTYTFKLRQGIKFHNGKEMTSEDVVASLTRWGKQSIYGKDLFAQVADLQAVDKYTVVMKLKETSAIVVINLAVPNSFAAIYPKEIAEKFPPQAKVTEYIGTGPFKMAEWKRDQYIRMVRFDGYKPRNEKPNGYGGAKVAYVDEIRWIPVPDVATRVAEIEMGVGTPVVAPAAPEDVRPGWVRRLVRNRNVLIGAALLMGLFLAALLADTISTHNPTRLFPTNRLKPPSQQHYLGTDEFGRDVFSLVVHGSRISLFVGGITMLLTSVGGVMVGLVAGYSRRLDVIVMREAFWVSLFPGLALTLAGLSLNLLGDGLRDVLEPRLRLD